jgi:hypothetical protein
MLIDIREARCATRFNTLSASRISRLWSGGHLISEGKNRQTSFDGASSAEQMARHRLGGADTEATRMAAEHVLDRRGFGAVA